LAPSANRLVHTVFIRFRFWFNVPATDFSTAGVFLLLPIDRTVHMMITMIAMNHSLQFYKYEGAEYMQVPFTDVFMRFEFLSQDIADFAKAHLGERLRFVVDKDSAIAWMWQVTHHSDKWQYHAMLVHPAHLPDSITEQNQRAPLN
jgi:hypothetical protein